MKDNNKSELGLIASKLDEIESDIACLCSAYFVIFNALFDAKAHEALTSIYTQMEQITDKLCDVHQLALTGCKNNGTGYAERLVQYEQEKQRLINQCYDLDASEFAKRLEELAARYNV